VSPGLQFILARPLERIADPQPHNIAEDIIFLGSASDAATGPWAYVIPDQDGRPILSAGDLAITENNTSLIRT